MTAENTKDPIQLAIDTISECLNDNDGYELNMSNYHHDDVHGINNAYVALFQTLEEVNGKLIALQSQPAAAHGVEGLLQAEKRTAWAVLKSFVYGGGNIGPDGKDDGGHRLIKGQIGYDDWKTIEAALTAPQPVADLEGLKEEVYAILKRSSTFASPFTPKQAVSLAIDHAHATGRLTTSADVQELKDAVLNAFGLIDQFNDGGPESGVSYEEWVRNASAQIIIEHAATIAKVKGE